MSVLKKLLLIPVVLIGIVVVLLVAVALAPARWLGDRAAQLAGDALGVPVAIERLSISPFSLTPSVRVAGLSVAAPASSPPAAAATTAAAPASAIAARAPLSELDARVALDLGAAVRGQLLFDRIEVSRGALFWQRDAHGSTSVDPLLQALGGEASPDQRSETASDGPAGPAIPAIRQLAIDGVSVAMRDEVTDSSLALEVSATGSTIDAGEPLSVELDGTLAREGTTVPASLSATLASDTPAHQGLSDADVELVAELDGLNVRVDGRVLDLMDRAEIDARILIEGDSLDAIQTLAAVPLPKVPAYRLRGTLLRDGSEWRWRRFDATLGDSVFEGDVRVDVATQPVTLFANVIFTAVDADELLAIAVSDGVEDAEADEQDEQVIGGTSGWFPDRALGLGELSSAFDGQIRLRADTIDSRWPVESLDVGVALQDRQIGVAPLDIGIAGGTLQGKVDIDTAAARPDGSLELDLTRIELVRIVEALGIDDDSAGVLGGRLRFWFTGDSIADMAGSLDGGTFLLMTGGRLDALLTELAGLDVVETVLLIADPGKTLTPVDCAYVDLLAREGVLDIERFVVDTRDTVIIADGTIDLGEETLDLALEPHAKDASLISVQGPVAISGGADELSIRPGPDMVARAALAGVLAAVATPAAGLLPLIRGGAGEDSVYCDGLVGKLDEKR